MSKIIGRLKDVGVAIESSRGVGQAPAFWVPKSAVSIEDKVTKARSALSYGTINLEGNQSIVAKKWAEGDLEFDLMDQSFGYFLYALLGSLSTSGPTDSAYTHTFSLSETNQHQSLAISVNETSIGDLMFKLAMINSMTITFTPDDVVKVNVSFMAKSSADTSQTVSYTAENKFVGRDLTFKLASLTSGLAGASNIPLKRLVLTIEKNTVLDHNLSTVQPEDILNQGFKITGEVELDYEDRTYRDLMVDGTYKAVRIALTNTRATIGASTNPAFTLDLSRVDFSQWESVFANEIGRAHV